MSFVNTVDIIGDEALTNRVIERSITEIADNLVISIGTYAFYNCKTLTAADFSAAKMIGDYAFQDCAALTTVNIPAATSIGKYALYRSALTTASFPAATSIDTYAFNSCTALTTADFPAATSIGTNVFAGCSKLTMVNFPETTSIGANAFQNCTALTTVNFPAAKTIGVKAFYKCTALTTVDFPVATSIGEDGFCDCSALTTADFPAAKSLGSYAFQRCTALTTADFPVATSFGTKAFEKCTSLTTLILRSETMCTLPGAQHFDNTPIASGTGYIYVPRALVDSYKAASNWSTYANQFRAIEDWPQICAKDTWEGVQASMAAGTYAADYKVGDTVALDLGSEGVVEMQIAAFDTDDLADGSGKAKITWVSKDLLATARRMNPARTGSSGAYTDGTGGVGGWEKTELRSVLKNTVKPLIPDAVQNMIVEVTKSHRAYDTAGTYSTQTTSEDVWIPSTDELSYGIYMGLFPDDESRKKYRQDGSLSNWWTRDAASTSSFYFVSNGNTNSSIAAGNDYGVALSFCTN